MKITWLGQAGLLIQYQDIQIIIDPYLSDSIEKEDVAKKRRMPIDARYLSIKPKILICTHNHQDHLDLETIGHYFKNTNNDMCVLAPTDSFEILKCFKGNHNYVLFNKNTEWTQDNILFKAVAAKHSDLHAIGVIIQAENTKIYITGDTLFSMDVIEQVKNEHIDILFLPINGQGNNLNLTDAARFAKLINPRVVVPMHYGMFDDVNPISFECKNKKIMKIYEEIIYENNRFKNICR